LNTIYKIKINKISRKWSSRATCTKLSNVQMQNGTRL